MESLLRAHPRARHLNVTTSDHAPSTMPVGTGVQAGKWEMDSGEAWFEIRRRSVTSEGGEKAAM